GSPTAGAIRNVRQREPEIVDAELVEDDGLTDDPGQVTKLTGPQSVADPTPRPSPEALAAHQKEQAQRQQREDHSRDFARTVWQLAEAANREDAADYLVEIWQPSQDIYPKPTTGDRIRQAADYLHDIADRWDQ